jgi:mRNA interferase HigB
MIQLTAMVVISKSKINKFVTEEPNSKTTLLDWYEETKKADWAKFSEIKNTFNSVDAVGNDLYIFNIGGNKYRLIARIIFAARTVFIKFIGTHKQYDKVKLGDL